MMINNNYYNPTMIIIKDESFIYTTVNVHRLYTDKDNFCYSFISSSSAIYLSSVYSSLMYKCTFVTEHKSKTCNFKPLLTRNETRNGLKGGRIISMTTAFLSSFYHRIRVCMSVYAR